MTLEELQRLHLFEPLSREQLARVRDSLRVRHCRAGEALFAQGDPAPHFFFVKRGAVKLYLLSRDGDEKVVEVIHADQLFAEAVMFMDERRYPVNATPLVETELVIFDNACFLRLLEESPGLAFQLLGALSRRIHGLLSHIDELTLHNATHRLVAYLLAHGGGAPGRVQLSAPKQVIASRLSMKPETLSRILARLRDRGLVRVKGDTLHLLDEAGLREMLLT
ncbi:Crp/Fnr family transcriptional regulator [Ectothiorhodospira mobilis]|uniref:Crp/Fnr family transcriptional regulator n=1 Tax=Ectothiorhodospira mobilis TaxID=195064 RepID=UPI00190863CD|nr:Crp/Fnr family transcriptional regulator [Ectothiorhodospira mobilis]MBK1690744.1 Crp/Fnr family transcriptional regulator [Ectothiorhodospira mobilis]